MHTKGLPCATQAARFFEPIVFRATPCSGGIAQSCAERLPGAATQAEAWTYLLAALRRDPALVGGEVVEVH